MLIARQPGRGYTYFHAYAGVEGQMTPFVDREREWGLAPKSINNAIGVVSAVLNRAARVWRTDEGAPWLKQAPAQLSRLSTKGLRAKLYPLSWDEHREYVFTYRGKSLTRLHRKVSE